MIFVSVGTQLPFPRMMEVIDEWAGKNKNTAVFAQTASEISLLNVKSAEYLSAIEFQKYFSEANIIVSHAGMGNILTALDAGKPIIIFPRKAEFNEHRNDHQVSTAKKFVDHPCVFIAEDVASLTVALIDIATMSDQNSRNENPAASELSQFLLETVTKWF
jgi:UDP-N-acetylglucosamine transferase subunit ALG13